MLPQQILQSSILDIIFDGRNKLYGAYELRKTYQSRVSKALISTLLICLVFTLFSFFTLPKKGLLNGAVIGPDVFLEALKEKPKQEIAIKKIEPTIAKQEPIKQIAVTNPLIVNEEINELERVKTLEEMENVKIGASNVDGIDKDDNYIAPPVESSGTAKISGVGNKEIDYEGIFKTVQIEASFIGGAVAWKKYLEKNLNRDLPSENGASAGKYRVSVSFIVDKQGNISNVVAENDPGFGTAEEAVRIIKKSPIWNAANQNGRAVAYRAMQVITFVVNE